MKVLGLISSPQDPASRARILQYGPYLKDEDVSLHCKFYKPLKEADPPGWAHAIKKLTGISEWRSSEAVKAIGRAPLLFQQTGYDIIWQNRLIQLGHSFWEKRLKKPVIFDFDDAIWMNEGEKNVKQKLQAADMVFAGNEYLAEYASRHNRHVKTIPTTVDTKTLFPLPDAGNKFTLGWIGTQSNFTYLEAIAEPVLDFLASEKNAQLMIVSSKMPEAFPPNNDQIIFKEWQVEKENEHINQFSVGIMPLPDDEWTRGKCGYKLLQYLACGKPVIASPVGVNKKILAESDIGIPASGHAEWRKAFLASKGDAALNAKRGNNGRKLVEEKYSCMAWTKPIISYMKTIA